MAQRERLSAAFGAAPLQRHVAIDGVEDKDVDAKLAAIDKQCSSKPSYKKLVTAYGEQEVQAAIRAMVTDPTPHGTFKLQQIGQPAIFLSKLADYMAPKAQAQPQAPPMPRDVVELTDGSVGVVLEVKDGHAYVQSIRKISSPPSSREYADEDPEWVLFSNLKKSSQVLHLQAEADTARPLKSFSVGARPKLVAKPATGSATAPVKFGIDRSALPEPAPSASKSEDGSRVVPKDLSFKPTAFHMNWNPTEGLVGARYIRQMALAGRLEGFMVVATVPEQRIQKFYDLVDDPAALENIQIRPVPEAHNPWAEDSGEFHTDGSVHVPNREPSSLASPGKSIAAARERRGFYGRPTDKDDPDIGRIGASVSENRLARNKIELAHASGLQAYENASHIEGGNLLSGTTLGGEGYALVGRDGVEATRGLLAFRLRRPISQVSDADVRRAISIDYHIAPKLIFFIEQPGEFHLDMSMVLMGPQQVIVNDCLEVFELQQEWMYADYLKLKPALDSGPKYEAWQKLGEELEGELARLAAHASRMFGYERRAVSDLVAAGLTVHRVAGAFPSGGRFLPGMNFLNGEGGIGADNQPFFVTNGGDPRAEQYVAQQYLQALGTGLKRLYFIDPEASRKSIEETSGGLGCRTKGEGSVQRVVQRVVQLGRGRHKDFKNERQKLSTRKHERSSDDEYGSDPRAPERDERTEYEEAFDEHLRHAMKLILGKSGGGVGGGVRFGSFWQAYDKTYWRLVTTPVVAQEADPRREDSDEESDEEPEPDRKLVLRAGNKPSDAIDFLFADLNAWAFDCADAIQVARWYAMRMAMGADEFDESVSGLEFALKSHESTGLKEIGTYSRTDDKDYFSPDAVLKFKPGGLSESREVEGSAESYVRKAPVGTRVMLTVDDDSAAGTDYENENLVKIGNNLFAGHPIGIGKLERLIELLAMTVLELDEEDEDDFTERNWEDIRDMKTTIYISQVELIEKR